MSLTKYITLVVLLGGTAIQAQVCTEKSTGISELDGMISFETGIIKTQCDPNENEKNECRYSKNSCDRSIRCSDIMMKGALAGTHADEIILDYEIQFYASMAIDNNLEKMKDTAAIIEFAKKLNIEIPVTCNQNYLEVKQTSQCNPELLSHLEIPVVASSNEDAPSKFYDFSANNNLLQEITHHGHIANGLKDIKRIKGEKYLDARKRLNLMLAGVDGYNKYVSILSDPRDASVAEDFVEIFLNENQAQNNFAEFIAVKTKERVHGKLGDLCRDIPSINHLCENVTLMRDKRETEVKRNYIPSNAERTTSINEDLGNNYASFVNKLKELNPGIKSPDRGVFLRILEAARCRAKGTTKFADHEKCDEVRTTIKETPITGALPEKSSSVKSHKRSDNYNSASVNTYLGTTIPVESRGEKLEEAKLPNALGKESAPSDSSQGSSAAASTNVQPAQTPSSNFVSNTDYNIPGTHPLATDANGIPIPPASLPESQQSRTSVTTAQVSSEVQAIQKKLDDAEAQIAKLNADAEKAKVKANEDEKNALKEKIKKLEEEKAAVIAQAAQQRAIAQAQAVLANVPAPIRSSVVANSSVSTAPMQNAPTDYVSQAPQTSSAIAPLSTKNNQTLSVVTKNGVAASTSAGSGDGSGNGLQITRPVFDVELVQDPQTPILFIVPPEVKAKYNEYIKSHPADMPFEYIQKGTILTIVPLKNEKGEIINFGGAKVEKTAKASFKKVEKAVKGPAPASVKPVVQTIKRADLIGTMNGAK